MKKSIVVLGNILIVLSVLISVIFDVIREHRIMLTSKTEAFGNMTAAMESVTTNYLEGEQRVCRSWANYINAHDMTAEEAVSFVRDSLSTPDVMAHIVFPGEDGLAGLSTEPRASNAEDYTVSYKNIGIFTDNSDAFLREDGTVNVTRSYTNPVNGIQSVAFCCRVSIRDDRDGSPREGVLLRIISEDSFEKEWVFPTEEYRNAEISLIDHDGNYIIKGRSFKNSNFFEFYRSYNAFTPSAVEELKNETTGEPGTFEMKNSTGQRCLIGHTRVNSTDDWVIVTLIPMRELIEAVTDWTLFGIVTVGLLLLLFFNLFNMISLNRQLKAAAVSADRANRAKTDFLSTMSHDIRTPMNAIIGLTAIASRNLEDKAMVRDNLHKINLAGTHLLTLINDILDISKVESGKLTLQPVAFSIEETAENLVNISQPMVKEKNIDFNFTINLIEHEYLYADQLRINQIFINILSNALKYTEPGGKVRVDLREEPGADEKSVCLIYKVSDTGIGMSPEFLAHMYQPFSRQTDSRINAIQGTGLGLAITKRMVDLMQGTIDCQSEVGKGTVFTVTLDLPLADKAESEMMLPPVRILLADDDEVTLETTKSILQSIGAEADTVKSGEEAIRKVTEGGDYQAVIMDLKMPEVNGIDAARRIREKIGKDLPILLISAYDWSELEEDASAAGINGFISKPLFRSSLYGKLSEVLGSPAESEEKEDDNADIAGMRVLVAEDNDINWEIISMLLQMHGVESERAENGQLAVERVAAASEDEFDLVFMDIQMPVMNGIDAAKAIRSLEDPAAAKIPIIAMTADAFSENVAECLAAGMNGHIAKPIDIKVVLKEMRRIREAKK